MNRPGKARWRMRHRREMNKSHEVLIPLAHKDNGMGALGMIVTLRGFHLFGGSVAQIAFSMFSPVAFFEFTSFKVTLFLTFTNILSI